IPNTWATDENGLPCDNACKVLDNLSNRAGGGLLPVGGAGMENGGHKGFCMATMVDVLCGVLSNGEVGTDVYGKKGEPSGVAHFIGAMNPAAFVGLDAMSGKMDYYSRMLKDSQKAHGQGRIYVPGEAEFEAEERNAVQLNILTKVYDTLTEIGSEFNLKLNKY
ncbi:MAG: Ldh family oxidoreductase, partial [bacterium]|nr:Ldh family oxidoreductase [bacterium]